jgi:hypothetical protein
VSRPFACGALLLAAFVLAVGAGRARAASPAEELFQEGRRLLLAGQTDEACARFAKSYAMVASSGTLLNLALCHQTQGKTATAWNEYRAAATLARNQGREDRATVADGKAQSLEATLSRVTTTAVDAPPGLQVTSDGGPSGARWLSVEVPIDPGVHHVTATAPGHLPWTTTLEVKEGEQVVLEIPRLQAERALPRAVPVGDVSSGGNVPAAPARSVLGYSLGAGGLVALAAGVVVWSVAYGKLQTSKEACAQGCSSSERARDVSDINALENVAVGAWIVGGALIVASGAYFALRGTRTTARVAFAPGGVSLQGHF